MSTPEPTVREIAEAIILSHTEDIEWGAINEMTEDEFNALGEDAHEALCHEVDDLISLAVVTVTWPGDEPVAGKMLIDLDDLAAVLRLASIYREDWPNAATDLAIADRLRAQLIEARGEGL